MKRQDLRIYTLILHMSLVNKATRCVYGEKPLQVSYFFSSPVWTARRKILRSFPRLKRNQIYHSNMYLTKQLSASIKHVVISTCVVQIYFLLTLPGIMFASCCWKIIILFRSLEIDLDVNIQGFIVEIFGCDLVLRNQSKLFEIMKQMQADCSIWIYLAQFSFR